MISRDRQRSVPDRGPARGVDRAGRRDGGRPRHRHRVGPGSAVLGGHRHRDDVRPDGKLHHVRLHIVVRVSRHHGAGAPMRRRRRDRHRSDRMDTNAV